MPAPKKPVSAYLLFVADRRKSITEANPGIRVHEVTKKAGELWRGLSEEEKQPYKDQAVERKKQYEVDFAAWQASPEAQAQSAEAPARSDWLVPKSRLVDLMKSGSKLQRMKPDAIRAMDKAVGAFIDRMADRASTKAHENGRATAALLDFVEMLYGEESMRFLRPEFSLRQARTAVAKARQQRQRKNADKAATKVSGKQQITSFFAAPKAAATDSAAADQGQAVVVDASQEAAGGAAASASAAVPQAAAEQADGFPEIGVEPVAAAADAGDEANPAGE